MFHLRRRLRRREGRAEVRLRRAERLALRPAGLQRDARRLELVPRVLELPLGRARGGGGGRARLRVRVRETRSRSPSFRVRRLERRLERRLRLSRLRLRPRRLRLGVRLGRVRLGHLPPHRRELRRRRLAPPAFGFEQRLGLAHARRERGALGLVIHRRSRLRRLRRRLSSRRRLRALRRASLGGHRVLLRGVGVRLRARGSARDALGAGDRLLRGALGGVSTRGLRAASRGRLRGFGARGGERARVLVLARAERALVHRRDGGGVVVGGAAFLQDGAEAAHLGLEAVDERVALAEEAEVVVEVVAEGAELRLRGGEALARLEQLARVGGGSGRVRERALGRRRRALRRTLACLAVGTRGGRAREGRRRRNTPRGGRRRGRDPLGGDARHRAVDRPYRARRRGARRERVARGRFAGAERAPSRGKQRPARHSQMLQATANERAEALDR